MLRTMFFSASNRTPSAYSRQKQPGLKQLSASALQFGGNNKAQDELALRNMPLVRQLQTRNQAFAKQFADNIKQAFGSYDAQIFGSQKATLLHEAMLYCSPKVVETLLRLGCNPEVTDLKERKPIDWLDIPANRQTPETKDEIRALLKNPPKVEPQPGWPWSISGIATDLWKTVAAPPAKKQPQSESEIMQAELQELQQKNQRMQKALGKFGVLLTLLNRKYQSQKTQNQLLNMNNKGAIRRLGNLRTEFSQTARMLALKETQVETLMETFQRYQKELEEQQAQIKTLQKEKKGLESAQSKQGRKNHTLTQENTALTAEKERLEARIKALKMNQDKNGRQITKFLDESSKKLLTSEQASKQLEDEKKLRGRIQLQLQQAVDEANTIEELQQSIQAIMQEIEESNQPPAQEELSLPEGQEPSPKLSKRRTKSMEFTKADLD